MKLVSSANDKIMHITTEIAKIEQQLVAYNALTKKYEDFRKQLFEVMTENEIKKFESPEGIIFTVVQGSAEKTEILLVFNEEKLKKDNIALYKKYVEQKEKVTKARASSLRITMPKKESE